MTAPSISRRWVGAAALAATALLAPASAHASDDFAVYSSRATFEAAISGTAVHTPSASGVTFGTSKSGHFDSISGPITFAPGAAGNLFGSTESLGYTYSPSILTTGTLTMSLPPAIQAFGFDYAYSPVRGVWEEVRFQGTFCQSFLGFPLGCDQYETAGLSGGSGFIGIVASSDLTGVAITGTAKQFQVANLTYVDSITATPEPASIALMATGLLALAGMGAARRRRGAVTA